METATTKPRRRFAISLRALMVLVLVIGGLIGWPINRAHTQRRAIEAIEASNGLVKFDYEGDGEMQPPGPAWLRRVIGDEYFQEVVGVSWGYGCPATAESVAWLPSFDRLELIVIKDSSRVGDRLARLRGLPQLKILDIKVSGGDDRALEWAGRCRNLEELSIEGGRVGDEGVSKLAGLEALTDLVITDSPGVTDRSIVPLLGSNPDLVFLTLSGTGVSDGTLEALADRPGLVSLDLARTRITDRGLVHLRGMPELVDLLLDGSAITDEGLGRLAGLGSLESLGLRDTRITDAGLLHLARLGGLKRLALSRTGVTDAGLVHLRGLAKLEYLSIAGLDGDGAGALELKKRVPGLVIDNSRIENELR